MSDKQDKILSLIYARNDKASAESFQAFLDNVVIDCRPEPLTFAEASKNDHWQRERNEWIVPAFEYVAGIRKQYDGPKNFWLGFPKGHDKTSYVARALNWATAYAKRPLRAYCCAKDSEQATIIWDSMQREATLNPWFAKRLDFKRHLVAGKDNGARVEILTSDAGGSQGKLPEILVYDEICHWDSRELFDALQSAKVKRGGHCISLVMTNAGYKGSWQWDLRNNAEKNSGKTWFFYEAPQRTLLASWMDPEEVASERQNIAESEAKRLFDNIWLDPSDSLDRYLSPDDVDECVGEPTLPPPNARVVLGIDYGGVHDRTALACVWWDGSRAHVVELKCFQGSPDNEVQIDDVRAWIDQKLRQYPRCTLVFDKYQMLETIQRLEREGRDVRRIEYRGGKANFQLAVFFRNLVQNHKLVFSKDCGFCGGETLAGELKRLIIKQASYGFRWDHKANGFDDKTTATAAACFEAIGIKPPSTEIRKTPPTQAPLPSQHSTSVRLPFAFDHARDRGLFGLR